jgi:hypothetical protein
LVEALQTAYGFAVFFAESLRLSVTRANNDAAMPLRRSLETSQTFGKPEAFRKENGEAVVN